MRAGYINSITWPNAVYYRCCTAAHDVFPGLNGRMCPSIYSYDDVTEEGCNILLMF